MALHSFKYRVDSIIFGNFLEFSWTISVFCFYKLLYKLLSIFTIKSISHQLKILLHLFILILFSEFIKPHHFFLLEFPFVFNHFPTVVLIFYRSFTIQFLTSIIKIIENILRYFELFLQHFLVVVEVLWFYCAIKVSRSARK